MFWNRSAPTHKELNPKELEILMSQGKVLVVDVREPNEYAAGHIPGSVNYPLSQFNPANVPHEAGKQTILSCAAGSRSAAALAKCAAAQSAIDTHLRGGFSAWASSGMPVER